MANLQIRIDDNLKTQAQVVANSMGLDLASAVRMFLTQMIRENRLPFQPSGDPFHSARNQAHLTKVIEELNNGVNCSAHELIEE